MEVLSVILESANAMAIWMIVQRLKVIERSLEKLDK